MNSSQPTSFHFKIRVLVALLLLALGFFGVILTDIKKDGAWNYWRFLGFVYAGISLALSFHLRKNGLRKSSITIWHELFHWTGLIGSLFICSYFVKIGLVGRFEASLLALLLLALATFLAGIYIESSFLILGILLGVFAAGIAFLDAYIYSIILPLTLFAAGLIVFFVHRAHKKLG